MELIYAVITSAAVGWIAAEVAWRLGIMGDMPLHPRLQSLKRRFRDIHG